MPKKVILPVTDPRYDDNYIKEDEVYRLKTDDEKIQESKEQAFEAIKTFHAEKIAEKSGNATGEERDTWPIKLSAAIDIISGDYDQAVATLADDTLSASQKIKARIIVSRYKTIVIIGNETKQQLAEKVIQKFEYLCVIIEAAEYLKRLTEKHTQSLIVTIDELELIDDVLEQARLTAEQTSTQL